jgi:hypothetical protein
VDRFDGELNRNWKPADIQTEQKGSVFHYILELPGLNAGRGKTLPIVRTKTNGVNLKKTPLKLWSGGIDPRNLKLLSRWM